jgi:hypothetical protein
MSGPKGYPFAARMRRARERLEARCIRKALAACSSVSAAARALGANRAHLHKRMRALGIQSPCALRKVTRSTLARAKPHGSRRSAGGSHRPLAGRAVNRAPIPFPEKISR